MESGVQLIQPLVALVIWSCVMFFWMYLTRIPAVLAMKVKLDPQVPPGVLMSQLPAKVRWKADNYNHLMEQPTVFYATLLSLTILDATTELNIFAAWAYVGLRLIHSFVQVLTNHIKLRFTVFVLSNIPLAVLVFNAAIEVI